MRVADYIAKFLKKKNIKDIFMLTGYGAMYLNDAIKLNGINYYATRNEATAPIMASAYSRLNNKIGIACVTAGPGATNAIPGLAEAFVESTPIMVFSGQVEYKHTTYSTQSKTIRTFGTAEINIIPIVKPLTKYCEIIKRPQDVRYVLEKAYYEANEGRPGPVWIDVPLDIQKQEVDEKKLRKFSPNKKRNSIYTKINQDIKKVISLINNSNKPIIFVGNGVKQSNTHKEINNISKKLKIPILTSRMANDLYAHKEKNIFGLAGIKGSRYCKKIMEESDLVISLGCRLAPQLIGHNFNAISNAKVISVDIERDELNKKGRKIDLKINCDLKNFAPLLEKNIIKKNKLIKKNFLNWINECQELKKSNPMITPSYLVNPIDLYYFMDRLDKISNSKHILVTDAGSNYYAGGQVWHFNSGQKEITSGSNAAMGLTIPLAIGSAIAKKNKQVLAVTGDGSLELNIQELKTISHYKLNIKLFVINNGGYVSMHKWQDNIAGRRLDTPEDTGDGTLNLKNISKAFELSYYKINNYLKIEDDLKKITSNNEPYFIEVMTDNKQKIFNAIVDN